MSTVLPVPGAYDRGVDPNIAFAFGTAVGLLLGVGVVWAWRYSERQQADVPQRPEPEFGRASCRERV